MTFDVDAVGKFLGGSFVLIIVIGAAAYTFVKVLRSDRTLAGVIQRIEQERDYYRSALTTEREESRIEREGLRRLLEEQGEDAKRERAGMTRQIEMLRGELQAYTMHRKSE